MLSVHLCVIDSSLAQAHFKRSLLTQTCTMVQSNNHSESIIVPSPFLSVCLFPYSLFQLPWTGFLSLFYTGFITATGFSAGVQARLCHYNWTRGAKLLTCIVQELIEFSQLSNRSHFTPASTGRLWGGHLAGSAQTHQHREGRLKQKLRSHKNNLTAEGDRMRKLRKHRYQTAKCIGIFNSIWLQKKNTSE